MSTDADKIRMIINIAGEAIPLTVPFDRQDLVRDTEACVGDLYDSWRRRFPQKSDKELLAMMAYQFASYYLELTNQLRDATSAVNEATATLEALSGKKSEEGRKNS